MPLDRCPDEARCHDLAYGVRSYGPVRPLQEPPSDLVVARIIDKPAAVSFGPRDRSPRHRVLTLAASLADLQRERHRGESELEICLS